MERPSRKGRGDVGEEFEREREKLHSKIGELTVKLDFLEKIQTARPVNHAELVEKNHPQLSVREQCELLGSHVRVCITAGSRSPRRGGAFSGF